MIDPNEPIPYGKLEYLKARTVNRFYDYILKKFLEKQQNGFTYDDLARRLDYKFETIDYLLATPEEWNLDIMCELLVGICNEELEPCSKSVLKEERNEQRDK